MHFLRVNVTFYEAVNMVHDVTATTNPFPYTGKFMFVRIRNGKVNKLDVLRYIEYVHSVAVY